MADCAVSGTALSQFVMSKHIGMVEKDDLRDVFVTGIYDE